jgi:hypothetical protein
MASLAFHIFERLMDQVTEVENVAARLEAEGDVAGPPILRRCAYVLAVAALDSYFHERGIELLTAHARNGAAQASSVANYIQSVSATEVSGQQGESHIRLRLSFKTLVAPKAVDSLLTASGEDAQVHWLNVAFTLNTRPDRLRRLIELIYDRRNQIAHEADWDVGQLDFRPMEPAHLADCVTGIRSAVAAFDAVI